jgi:hypothetical protein
MRTVNYFSEQPLHRIAKPADSAFANPTGRTHDDDGAWRGDEKQDRLIWDNALPHVGADPYAEVRRVEHSLEGYVYQRRPFDHNRLRMHVVRDVRIFQRAPRGTAPPAIHPLLRGKVYLDMTTTNRCPYGRPTIYSCTIVRFGHGLPITEARQPRNVQCQSSHRFITAPLRSARSSP